MDTEFLVYLTVGGRPEIVADELHSLDEALRFADYLSVFSRIPRRSYVVTTDTRPRAK
jgi:hypothetical protein